MNSGSIAEATVARLRNPASEAVALNQGPLLLRDIEATLRVVTQRATSFAEVFDLVGSRGAGAIGLLFILSRPDVSTHAVIITNYEGEPTIMEAQSWGEAYPQTIYTSASEAEKRYGTDVELWFGFAPPVA